MTNPKEIAPSSRNSNDRCDDAGCVIHIYYAAIITGRAFWMETHIPLCPTIKFIPSKAICYNRVTNTELASNRCSVL